MQARDHLQRLVGKELRTVGRGERNEVHRLEGDDVVVATSRSPEGTRVPIAWVQEAMDRLAATGELEVTTRGLGDQIGHRSAFIGAVLSELDGCEALTDPPRICIASAGGPDWELAPGEVIKRKTLHQRYGGGGQGGIAPSARSANVLIFSDPKSGEQHGYIDGWQEDGCFHYTGEGQVGDQQLTHGNKAIAEHASEGRSLRVFDGVAGDVTYVGQFVLDRETYRTDAPESKTAPSGGRLIRQVLVFPLRPVDKPAERPSSTQESQGASTTDVPVEEQNTERAFVDPSGEIYEIERREQRLVLAYQADLEAQGYEVGRNRIRPPGEAKPLFSDVHDRSRNNLIEAKGSGSRANIRMAIGQLADYARFLSPEPAQGVLLPDRPREDLEQLLSSCGIAAIWQTYDGFEDNAHGQFT